jgi:hypothetical protein
MKRFIGRPQEEFVRIVVNPSSLKNRGGPETARHGKKHAANQQPANEKKTGFPGMQIPLHIQ